MLIPLDQLESHPHNANVMPEALLAKLVEHIRMTGLYPPLIVRALAADRFQILDGHHRAMALRRLGRSHAECEAWDVSDAQATMLLLTLNRLHGEDDPHRRGELLAILAARAEPEELAAWLPDDAERIESLLALAGPPPLPPPPEADLPPMPRVLTFFLEEALHDRALQRLGQLDRDRNLALAKALGIDGAVPHEFHET